MKHKMKFLVLGCVVLVGLASFGLASFVNAEDDMLPVNPIFRDKALKDRVFDESKMRKTHGTLDPVQSRCRTGLSTEELFERADIVFTGTLIDKSTEEKVVKQIRHDINLIHYTHMTVFKAEFEVIEILKSPEKFNDKTIHVDMHSGAIGEKFMIHAYIENKDGVTRFRSNRCNGNKKLLSEK